MLFDLSNLPYWLFLGAGVCLFLFVIAAGGQDDDVDVDADVDLEVFVNSEIDVDNIAADLDLLGFNLLSWLGIGSAPLLLLLAIDLSLWGVSGWLLNVAIASWFGQPVTGLAAAIVMLMSMGMALATGSLIARPLGQVFAAFGEDAKSNRLIGCLGTVSSALIPAESEGRIGQVDVIDPARNLVTVNAVVPNWAIVLPKYGEKVLVIEHQQHYLVIALDSTDEDRWFERVSTKKNH